MGGIPAAIGAVTGRRANAEKKRNSVICGVSTRHPAASKVCARPKGTGGGTGKGPGCTAGGRATLRATGASSP